MRNFRQMAIRDNLKLRAEVKEAVRRFFIDNDYLEVDTPVRIYAPAPESHIDAEPSGAWFLRTSPELCMKRLLAAGYDRIFQIGKCFRMAERGGRHLPEMTLIEWYRAGQDYTHMMDQCEKLVRFVSARIGFGEELVYQGSRISLARGWSRISVFDAFERYASVSLSEALSTGRFDEAMGLEIEPCLGFDKPVFLYDYPASKGALAKLKEADRNYAERFELYIAGVELCNAFTELNDPSEQRERFMLESSHRDSAGKQPYPVPEAFLASLDEMPDATGNALGFDRLVMLFADTDKIDDVTAFTPEEM